MAERFKFLVGTKALLNDDNGNYLFLKRGADRPSNPNFWDLPGGLMEETDEPEMAIHREITEEIGLKVDTLQILGLTKFLRKEDLTICILFTDNINARERLAVKLSEEHSEYRWLPSEEIENLEIQPWLKELVLKKVGG